MNDTETRCETIVSEDKDMPTQTPMETQPEPPKAGFEVTETGELTLGTLGEQLGFADKLMKSGMVSSTFKTPQQVLIGMQHAKAMKIPVVVGLKMMYVIKGTPTLWGDGPLMMVQRTGLVEGFKEFFIDKDMNEICVANKNVNAPVYASVTRIKRKNDSEWQEDYFSIEDLKLAGLGGKDTYKKFKRNMMRYKARSMAIKSKFADFLNGVDIAEYHHHFSPETPEIVHDDKTLVDNLNQDVVNI